MNICERKIIMDRVLQVKDLKIDFNTDEGRINVIKDLSYDVKKGEIVGIVGESGCGKTISSLATIGLLPPNGIIEKGEIIFEGIDILKLKPDEIRKLRGRKISMIFQEPMKALDPVFTIGNQIEETILNHYKVSKKEAYERTINILKTVEIPNPKRVVNSYPHELSGGMKQRIMIAMALVCEPTLLIADEPTTALDVTIQAQILDLMKNLRSIINSSIIFITHDLGVVADICDRIMVMYAGQIVEQSDKIELFTSPKHPYTKGLLNSIPKLNEDKEYLNFIDGTVPSPKNFPKGCRFAPRCQYVKNICRKDEPPIYNIDKAEVKCWLFGGDLS